MPRSTKLHDLTASHGVSTELARGNAVKGGASAQAGSRLRSRGKAAAILGAVVLLGAPLLAIVKVVCDRIDALKPVGELLGQ